MSRSSPGERMKMRKETTSTREVLSLHATDFESVSEETHDAKLQRKETNPLRGCLLLQRSAPIRIVRCLDSAFARPPRIIMSTAESVFTIVLCTHSSYCLLSGTLECPSWKKGCFRMGGSCLGAHSRLEDGMDAKNAIAQDPFHVKSYSTSPLAIIVLIYIWHTSSRGNTTPAPAHQVIQRRSGGLPQSRTTHRIA